MKAITKYNEHGVDKFFLAEWKYKVIGNGDEKIKILSNNIPVKYYKIVLQQKEPWLS